MKLCRFGPKGHEKPGLIDGSGALRSLAGHRPDLTTADLTATGLAELRSIDPTSLPLVPGEVRYGDKWPHWPTSAANRPARST